jgi:tetratricopeptide (TPR) repeat protein
MSDVSDDLTRHASRARREHRPGDAKRDLVEAVDLCRRAGTRIELAKALTGLGQIERDLHEIDAARGHYEEAVAIYREEGDALKLAHTIRHLGDILRHEEQRELAESCYREALDLYRAHAQTPPLDLANAIRGWAILKGDAGEVREARLLWEEARGLYSAVKVEAGVAESSRRLALLERRVSGSEGQGGTG